MPKASTKQVRYLVSLAQKAGHKVEYDDFIDEHNNVCIEQSDAHAQIKQYLKELGQVDECDVMRKKIISMAKTIGWTVRNYANPAYPLADMNRIQNWCIKYGRFHKHLNAHNREELIALVTQFENGPYKTGVE